VELLIDEISIAAYEAIEQAASEAARVAILASLERETAALREAAFQQAEAFRWRMEAELRLFAISEAKKTGRRNTILATAIGVAGGLVVGGILGFGGR